MATQTKKDRKGKEAMPGAIRGGDPIPLADSSRRGSSRNRPGESRDVFATARYQRITPQKIERMLDVVRNKPATLALAQLNVLPHSAAVIVKNVLKSAMANATHNHNMKADQLVVSRAVVGPAGMMKRMRAVSRGRGHLILKKLSHISIFVRERA